MPRESQISIKFQWFFTKHLTLWNAAAKGISRKVLKTVVRTSLKGLNKGKGKIATGRIETLSRQDFQLAVHEAAP